MQQSSRTWIEINSLSLHQNLNKLSAFLGHIELGVVVKANAYGHGMFQIASLFENNPSVGHFFTASLAEALLLRKAGSTKKILSLSYPDIHYHQAILNDIAITIYDISQIDAIIAAASLKQKKAIIHLMVDTGMSHHGLAPHTVLDVIKKLSLYRYIEIEGIYTHYSDPINADMNITLQQQYNFNTVIGMLKQENITLPYIHSIASGSLHLSDHNTLSRVGTLLFGSYKNLAHFSRLSSIGVAPMQQILTWKARPEFIREKTLYLPIGTLHGVFFNSLTPNFAYHRGKLFPIIECSNDHMMVKISADDKVTYQDEFEILGPRLGISAYEYADRCSTIVNEITTCIDQTIERKIV